MSGPWDNYAPQQTAQAGPWAKYGAQAPASNPLSDAYRQAFLAGDTVKAHQVAVQARQQGIKIAPINDADINQSVDQRFQQSVQNEGAGQRALEGAGKSFTDTAQGVGELVGTTTPQEVAQSRQMAAPLMGTTAGKLGYAGGTLAQILGTAELGGGVAAGLRGVGLAGDAAAGAQALNAGQKLGRIGGLVAGGAAQGYVAPYATSGEHDANTIAGALAGPALVGAGKVVGKVATGFATPEARRLIEQGVKLTPGQMLGGRANALEQAVTSSPVTGDIIAAGRANAMKTFNQSAINKALAPIGQKLPRGIPAGQKALAWAADRASGAYEDALSNTQAKIDGPLLQRLGAIAKNAPPQAKDEIRQVIQNDVLGRLSQNGGTISGADYSNLVSDLGKAKASYTSAPKQTSSDRAMARSISDILGSLNDMYTRVNGPEAVQQLANARQAYKGFATLRDATNAAGRTRQGVFTPGEFLGAVKKGDKTQAKGAFAKGQAYMQDFGNDAQDVVGNTMPNSFTTDRWNKTHLGGWLAGLGALPLTAAYVPGGRRVAQAVIAPEVGTIRAALGAAAQNRAGQVTPIAWGLQRYLGAQQAPVPLLVAPQQ